MTKGIEVVTYSEEVEGILLYIKANDHNVKILIPNEAWNLEDWDMLPTHTVKVD